MKRQLPSQCCRSLTIDSTAGNPIPAGGLGYSGAAGLIKTGAGTVPLSGTNTYTGGTTVSVGILVINSVNAFPAGRSLTIGAGGTSALAPSSITTSNATITMPSAASAATSSDASVATAVPRLAAAPGLNANNLRKPVPAGALGTPATDRVVWSSSARRIAADPAGLRQAANRSDSSAHSDLYRKKAVAIQTWEAVFAEAGR